MSSVIGFDFNDFYIFTSFYKNERKKNIKRVSFTYKVVKTTIQKYEILTFQL